LERKMRVIPSRSVLGGLPFVGQRFSGCNRALRDTGDSIILGVVQLADSMPVD
jgi:hypothetical protein